MINDKIGKLISELDTAAGTLIVLSLKDKIVYEAREKIQNVSIELGNLIDEIEAEKAIDGCRVRLLAIEEETGDCGTDENGRCIGYANSGGEPCDECKECIYSVDYEEE